LKALPRCCFTGITSVLVAACTVSPDRLPRASHGLDLPVTLTLAEELTVVPDTAKAWLGSASDRHGGVRCYVESNDVAPLDGEPLTLPAGDFDVASGTVATSPLSLARIRTLNEFRDSPSFYTASLTLNLSADDRDDVRAVHCVETFTNTYDVHLPDLADLRQQAGQSLTF